MFAVNTTSPLEILADHRRRGPQTVKKNCCSHISGGRRLAPFSLPISSSCHLACVVLVPKARRFCVFKCHWLCKGRLANTTGRKKKYRRSCSNRSADCPLSPLPCVKACTAKHSVHDFSMTRHKPVPFFFFFSFLLCRLCWSCMNCTGANIRHSFVEGIKWYALLLISQHRWVSYSRLSTSLHFAHYVLCCLWHTIKVLQCFWLNKSVSKFTKEEVAKIANSYKKCNVQLFFLNQSDLCVRPKFLFLSNNTVKSIKLKKGFL